MLTVRRVRPSFFFFPPPPAAHQPQDAARLIVPSSSPQDLTQNPRASSYRFHFCSNHREAFRWPIFQFPHNTVPFSFLDRISKLTSASLLAASCTPGLNGDNRIDTSLYS